MKQEISPKLLFSVIGIGIVLLVGIGFWVFRQGPAPPVSAAPPVQDRTAGGPTAADLAKRDEYNRTHPDAAGSR